MPNYRSTLTRSLVAAAMVLATSSFALAQQPPTSRIRGTIEGVDGATLMIKSREGADMKVRMTDNVAVFGVTKTAHRLVQQHAEPVCRLQAVGARGGEQGGIEGHIDEIGNDGV